MKEQIYLIALALTITFLSFFVQPTPTVANSNVANIQSVDFTGGVEYEREYFASEWWVFVYEDGELIDIYPEE